MSTRRLFVLPDLGEGLTEAELVTRHVAAGDAVTLNQVLAEVETEKAVVELPSPFAGTVVQLLAEAGDTVPVGAPLIAIDTEADTETGAETASQPDPGQGATEEVRVPTLVGYGPTVAPPSRRRANGSRHLPQTTASPATGAVRPLASPPVRFSARQNGVDLADVTATGPGGIVTREDLVAHLDKASAHEPGPRETRAPVRGVQKHMAEAMTRSVATAPQACVFLTVDATATVEVVASLRRNPRFEGLHVTPLGVAARAVVLALRDHPTLNSAWDESTDEVVLKRDVHLGVAVASPRGLIVPNIKNAQDLTLHQLTTALTDLTETARAGRCTTDDLRGGTITITNVGVFGVDAGVPILNPGEAAIIAVGSLRRRPWEFEGEIALRQVVTLSLVFDHRLVDGQAASLFLRDVGDFLFDPTNLIAFA